jgi:phage I-like protein
MPVPKPNSGEKQSAFMKRCMSEVSGNPKRSQAQNVAICMDAWRGGGAKAESVLIKGELTFDLEAGAPDSILYMPAGSHTIYCRVNGEPKEIDVHVDAETAAILQQDLEELLKEDVKPFIDFNHDGKAAAATPIRFSWRPGQGVFLDLEWSRTGKENVEGKDFKHFSPTFQISKDGTPQGLPETGPIGALVNNPAFRRQREILDQIAAELAAPNQQQHNKKMQVEAKGLAALAKELFGDQAPDDDDEMPDKLLKKIKTLKATLADAEAKAKKAADDADDANARKEEAQAEVVALKQGKAQGAVDAAIAAGAMPGKDERTKKFYVEAYLRDPEGTQHALNAMGTRPALKPVVKVDGADRRDIGAARVAAEAADNQRDQDRAEMMAQRAVIAKVRMAHPTADADTVLLLAKAEHPDAFANG